MKVKTDFRVVIAEDEHRIRENLAKKINSLHSRFTVAGTAANGREALELVDSLAPDLLITDIKMPVMTGLELIEELYLTHPELPVLIISGFDEFSYAKKAIHFGVKDYILKPVSMNELVSILESIELKIDKNTEYLSDDNGRWDSGAASRDLCGRLTEYLKSSYTEDVSITGLAETFRLNPTYMSRIFKQQTGRTPTRYLTELRINRAKKLLSENQILEVKEISTQLGFQDQNYFSRLFKKETGMSPVEFRSRL